MKKILERCGVGNPIDPILSSTNNGVFAFKRLITVAGNDIGTIVELSPVFQFA